MLRINILDRNSRFWFPFIINRNLLKEHGITFKITNSVTDDLLECDVVFLSSRFFPLGSLDQDESKQALESLAQLSRTSVPLNWFDLRDSSGTTQFEVLPFVKRYLKKQLLKDRDLYRKPLYGNRVYTDYFHRVFGIDDTLQNPSPPVTPLKPGDETKLGLSWNIGLEDNRLFSPFTRVIARMSDWSASHFSRDFRIPFRSPSTPRDLDLLGLFGTHYTRATIAYQRLHALGILKNLASTDRNILYGQRVSLSRFRKALFNSRIALSLFGWGEICYRDFESFIAGAALMMPDVSHLDTWPKFHEAGVTYQPLRWDLADLESSLDALLSHPERIQSLARTGQERYLQEWSLEGRTRFCARLRNIV